MKDGVDKFDFAVGDISVAAPELTSEVFSEPIRMIATIPAQK